MTKEEIIDLLTLARVYDARVTVGKAETAAWFLAVNRVPVAIGHQAVVEHYTAAIEPGHEYPRIAPGHVMAYYQTRNRPDDKPLPPAISPKASPEFVAARKAEVAAITERLAARYELDHADPDRVPRWRPGMDKQELALRQAEASRRQRGDPITADGQP
jgi:hypothetical protein